MAVCNIFKPLENPTGTFLLFSQYSEDLIRESTQSEYYRVIPSKFIALDINYQKLNNTEISKFLQDGFENGCAICRNKMNNNWKPEYAANLFWNAMFDQKYPLLSIDAVSNIIPQIKYVGDINMLSYNEYNGMGYSEVFCYIPTDSKASNYTGIIPDFINNKSQENKFIVSSNPYIEGYEAGEVMINGIDWGLIQGEYKYHPDAKYEFSWENLNKSETEPINNNDKYYINTIIVLYDIISRTDSSDKDNIIYKNIPMGIYFTGTLDEKDKEIGGMSNKIVKYVSNKDIYGSGSSYGLKICSRFSITPNSSIIPIKEVEVTSGSSEESLLSILLSEMSITQSKMDDLISSMQTNMQDKKDFLASFRNYRTNVPYVKEVGDKQYWFVNGRMVCEIKNAIKESDKQDNGLFVTLNIFDNNSKPACFDKSEPKDKYNININWNLYMNNIETEPGTGEDDYVCLKINDNPAIEIANHSYPCVVGPESIIKIIAKKGNMESSSSKNLPLVWPTYFGGASSANPEPSEIQTFMKEAIPTKNNKKTYTNIKSATKNDNVIVLEEDKWVTLAYPASFGELSHIYDKTGYDYILDFNLMKKEFIFNQNNILYNIYTEVNKGGVENYTLIFS